MSNNIEEDARKTGLKNGLRQLTNKQIEKVLNYPGPILLDSIEHENGNYREGKFCPLAIAFDLHHMHNPSQTKVEEELRRQGLTIFNTRSIEGEFFTENRERDFKIAAQEVIDERSKDA